MVVILAAAPQRTTASTSAAAMVRPTASGTRVCRPSIGQRVEFPRGNGSSRNCRWSRFDVAAEVPGGLEVVVCQAVQAEFHAVADALAHGPQHLPIQRRLARRS